MSILRLTPLFTLFIATSLRAEPSPAEQKVTEAIKSQRLERRASLGALVLELPGGTEKRRLGQNSER